MRYDRILRRVWVKIGEDEYALSFNLSTIGKLDAMMNGQLISRARTQDYPIQVLTEGFRDGLRNCDKGISLTAAKGLCEQFVLENGLQGLVLAFYGILAVSGLMGPKVTNQMLKDIGMLNLDGEEKEEKPAKNETMPKG